MSTFFPNEKFGGDYKDTATYRAYKNGEQTFATEIKSAIIKIFNADDKTYTSVKILNKPEEVLQLASYMFDFLVLDNPNAVLAQCNHTFVFHIYGNCHAHVGFSTDVLKERPFNLYDY